jgi:hypothetical protein
MAHMLNRHEDVRCLIEPFHPERYGGKFNRLAMQNSLGRALEEIWSGWNAIKHVWEPSGWPFVGKPEMNREFLLSPETNVVFLIRRNLLRRFVSTYISRYTRYWIGSREEFLTRLSAVNLIPLDAKRVRAQLSRDAAAVNGCLRLLEENRVSSMVLYYEDMFGENVPEFRQLQIVRTVLSFLKLGPISDEVFERSWKDCLDPTQHRWSSPDVYAHISNIRHIEAEVGCDETGWLFK